MVQTCKNPLKNEKIHRVDSGEHWPTSIKETIQWFPFLTIMEHTANNMENNNWPVSLLLNLC